MAGVPLDVRFRVTTRGVLGLFDQLNDTEGSVFVVAEVSETAHRETQLVASPALFTPATLAPMSVIAISPITVVPETIATLNSRSSASATYAVMSLAIVLAG